MATVGSTTTNPPKILLGASDTVLAQAPVVQSIADKMKKLGFPKRVGPTVYVVDRNGSDIRWLRCVMYSTSNSIAYGGRLNSEGRGKGPVSQYALVLDESVDGYPAGTVLYNTVSQKLFEFRQEGSRPFFSTGIQSNILRFKGGMRSPEEFMVAIWARTPELRKEVDKWHKKGYIVAGGVSSPGPSYSTTSGKIFVVLAGPETNGKFSTVAINFHNPREQEISNLTPDEIDEKYPQIPAGMLSNPYLNVNK